MIANAQALAKGLEAEGMRAGLRRHRHPPGAARPAPIGVTGAEAETRCDAARITLNKNAIPYDPAPPLAVRHPGGHAERTTQGMGEGEMAEVAALMARAVKAEHGTAAGDAELAAIADDVTALVARSPPTRAAEPARPVVPPDPFGRGSRSGSTCSPRSTAAVVTFLLAGPVRMLALRFGAVAWPRGRDVHVTPTPRWGGLAMFGGVLAGVGMAHQLPALRLAFDSLPEVLGVLLGGGAARARSARSTTASSSTR